MGTEDIHTTLPPTPPPPTLAELEELIKQATRTYTVYCHPMDVDHAQDAIDTMPARDRLTVRACGLLPRGQALLIRDGLTPQAYDERRSL